MTRSSARSRRVTRAIASRTRRENRYIHLDSVHSPVAHMEDDYYSVESILAENQKIQCTFKTDIPDMGHLDGGNERDVCLHPRQQG